MHEQAQLPKWVVLVSKPSEEAMTPVYHLALTVAAVGIALILVLFIVGVAISNREIILPILRLREATAAVGRGELNVRLLSTDPHGPAGQERDPTFRRDELGDLARDFDEMTRQLQKNLNQLARSNEAKRRFMELAGHELRTPVTYLLGVCQLAQRQIQQLSEAATDGLPENEQSIALAGKNAAAVQGALTKIAAKTQRLSRIIDNLLKLVTNDQFTTRMNKAPVDIRALLLQVTSDLRPFIVERKQQLTVDVAENHPDRAQHEGGGRPAMRRGGAGNRADRRSRRVVHRGCARTIRRPAAAHNDTGRGRIPALPLRVPSHARCERGAPPVPCALPTNG